MIKERIEKLLKEEGITSSKFADEIGTQRSSISHILSGRNKPGLEIIQKILSRYRNLNSEWLITGRGDIYKTDRLSTDNKADEPLSDKGVENNVASTLPFHNLQDNEKVVNIEEIQENDAKKIDKIVVFYTDNSFEEYFSK